MLVGIDAGQTGIRAAREGAPPGPTVPGVRRMEGAVGPDDVAAALIAGLQTVAAAGPITAIGVGLSGFELATGEDLARIAGRLAAAAASGSGGGAGGPVPVAIATDGVTSLLGALGAGRAGVVVAAGTGVVVLGHDGADGWAKVDGWGSLLGDDGSAFAVGQAGLRAALRDHDGRAGSPALRAAAQQRWGTMDAVPTGVLREQPAVSRTVASFAPAVAAAAQDGDPTAIAIWERAGTDLAAAAVAACARLFAPGTAVPVAAVGNLWQAGPLLTEPYARALAAGWPAAEAVPAAGTSLDGAIALARSDGPAPVAGLLWRS